MTSTEILLEAENLRKIYRRSGTVFSRESEGARFTAVANVSFAVPVLPSIWAAPLALFHFLVLAF
jgi:hypothetical protein